jgi:hypothetical protein
MRADASSAGEESEEAGEVNRARAAGAAGEAGGPRFRKSIEPPARGELGSG